jgi:hypothetical protein
MDIYTFYAQEPVACDTKDTCVYVIILPPMICRTVNQQVDTTFQTCNYKARPLLRIKGGTLTYFNMLG